VHLSDGQKARRNAEIFGRKFREVLAHKDEIAEAQQAASVIFAHLVAQPTWSINEGPRPKRNADGTDWIEPEEIWSEIPQVTKK
jgi:hypothetical protein